MKRRMKYIPMIILILLLGINYYNHSSLEKVVSRQSGLDHIKIEVNDTANGIVVFSDDHSVYMADYMTIKNLYYQINDVAAIGKDKDHTSITIFSGEKVGNILWGVIGNEKGANTLKLTLSKNDLIVYSDEKVN